MPEKKKAAGAGGAKVCKECGKQVFARADGTYAHERRGAIEKPDDANAKKPAAKEGEQEPELPPNREHGLMRRIGGKREE